LHLKQGKDVLKRPREKLRSISERHNLQLLLPNELNTPASFDESVLMNSDQVELESDEKPAIELENKVIMTDPVEKD